MPVKKTKGTLILKKIEFDNIYKRHVHKSSNRAGAVTLPVNLVGKMVYVVVESEVKT